MTVTAKGTRCTLSREPPAPPVSGAPSGGHRGAGRMRLGVCAHIPASSPPLSDRCLTFRGRSGMLRNEGGDMARREQLIMQGVVSEMDVFRSVMRRIGARGGHMNTPAQHKARCRNLRKATAARWRGHKATG